MDFHLNLSIEMQTVDWNVALKKEIVSKIAIGLSPEFSFIR